MARDTTNNPNTPDRNPDPITGAPGSHPDGVAIGSASGAITGGLAGALGGPIGAVIGAIVGGISGGYVGKAAGEAHDPTEDAYWRDEHKNRPYFKAGTHDYDRDLQPAYQYGSAIYRGVSSTPVDSSAGTHPGTSNFEAHENDIRSGWDKVKGRSTLAYDEARNAIRDAYDRQTLRGSSTSSNPTTTTRGSV